MGPSPKYPKLLSALGLAALFLSSGCFCRAKPVATPSAAELRRHPDMNRSLLGGEGPPRLVVHVDWIEGSEPEPYALKELRKWLVRETARPPESITVERGRPVPREAGEGQVAIEATVLRNASPPPDTHFVYVLYWDRWKRYRGVYFPAKGLDRKIAHETVVMFVDPIEKQSLLWLTRRKVEAAVLVHEFGHGAGLVTSGAHADGNGHCSNAGCRMYWGVDRASIRKNLFPVLCRGVLEPGAFCAQCEADLSLGREKDAAEAEE